MNAWVSEKEFEVKGDQVKGATMAPEKGRLNPNTLFTYKSIYIDPKLEAPGPSKQELIELAQRGGACIVKTKPKTNTHALTIKTEADKKRFLDKISLYENEL